MTKARIAREVVLWFITVLVALVCLRSGVMKMPGVPGVEFWVRDFARWSYPDWFRVFIGIAELISFGLLLIPRFAAYGATLFGLVMLGAIFTHATHGESVRLPFNILLLVFCVVIVFGRWRRRIMDER